MALTPVGARLFLAGIEYSTQRNHLLVKSGDIEVMIVEDAFLDSQGVVAYNAAVRGSGSPDDFVSGVTADEAVAFVQRKLASPKMADSVALDKIAEAYNNPTLNRDEVTTEIFKVLREVRKLDY